MLLYKKNYIKLYNRKNQKKITYLKSPHLNLFYYKFLTKYMEN